MVFERTTYVQNLITSLDENIRGGERPWWGRRRASRPVSEFLRFSGQSVELSGILPRGNFIKLFFIVTKPHFLSLHGQGSEPTIFWLFSFILSHFNTELQWLPMAEPHALKFAQTGERKCRTFWLFSFIFFRFKSKLQCLPTIHLLFLFA